MLLKKNLFFAISIILSASFLYCGKKNNFTGPKYAYLQSPIFQERLILALEWVKDCDIIIEIGGGLNPISNIAKDKKVIVIDPVLKNKEENNISHISKNFESWHDANILANTKYAVVIIGFALELSEQGWLKLLELIENSHKTVIEYSLSYKKAKKDIKFIKKNVNKSIINQQELDYSKYFDKNQEVNPFRKIICLSNANIIVNNESKEEIENN